MVDPVSQKVMVDMATQIGGSGSVGGGADVAATPSAVSSSDAASFQSQINGTPPPDAAGSVGTLNPTGMDASAAGQGASAQSTAQSTASIHKPNMGDRILNGLQGMSNDMQATRQQFVDQVSGGGKMAEMYKMQLDVAQLTTTQTIVGQAGSKTSQGAQTLLKGQ